jgi:DNA primase
MTDPAEPVTAAVLRDLVQQHAVAITTPGQWAGYLRLAARTREPLFANVLLIGARQPAATMVRGSRDWHKQGREVTGQPGITIFSAPRAAGRRSTPREQPGHPRYDREQDQDRKAPDWRAADRTATVWDITQTTGPPVTISEPVPAPAGQVPPGLWDALCHLARRQGFDVEREQCPDPDGSLMWSARRIRIHPAVTGPDAVWALAHQLGHALLHHDPARPPGTTTTGCTGLAKTEADSAAYLLCARHGPAALRPLPHPHAWAGRDPRAQPGAVMLAAGQKIITATAPALDHLDQALPARQARIGIIPGQSRHTPRVAPPPAAIPPPAQPPASPRAPAEITSVLADAHAWYLTQLPGSWAPGYLHDRGITDDAITRWEIGYAPAGWTALTSRLRRAGHTDEIIQAAGLARRSSRGTLIDHFRDRILFPVRDQHGDIAGFTGRARPGAPPGTPKYLNTPDSAAYRKGELLFGLEHARPDLAQGAIPVLAEGPLDAIAVSIADPGRHAGLAPCGTALTGHQAALLASAADLHAAGIIVAFDTDNAGRAAAIRAHGTLSPFTSKLQTVCLAGKDPAETLQAGGPPALRAILRDTRQPLSALLIDTRIARWERQLHDTEGPYRAMQDTATLIAALLPPGCAAQIRQITDGRLIRLTDDMLRPLPAPDLPHLAVILPADTQHQILRTATRLGFDTSEVLAETVNAALRARSPKGQPPRINAARSRGSSPAQLAATSFPHPPLAGAGIVSSAPSRSPAPPAQARKARRAL